MSGVRKTIYVPDDFDWDGLQVRAKDMGMSVSQLLLSDIDQLDRIESKLDQLICGFGDKPVANYEHKDLVVEIPVEKIKAEFINALADEDVDLEAEELRQANERLLKKRSQIKGAIKTSSDIPDRYRAPEFTGGVPKAKWKGAKC